jgi:hypothetical protein
MTVLRAPKAIIRESAAITGDPGLNDLYIPPPAMPLSSRGEEPLQVVIRPAAIHQERK